MTGKTAGSHAGIWNAEPERAAAESLVDVLGSGLRRLPPPFWQPRMLFAGASDRELKDLTGTFPATFRSHRCSHPLFVLAANHPYGHEVCPCSSKDWGARRWIRVGCTLKGTGWLTDRHSYLVESCRFLLPSNPEFSRRLRFLGRVPETCLETRRS